MFENLKKRFYWQPEPEAFIAPFFIQETLGPRTEGMSKGIDNTHIDVALSPRFMEHTHLLVRQELLEFVADQRWGSSRTNVSATDLQVVRDEYIGMMTLAVNMVRETSRLAAIPLLQFSVIKFLFQVLGLEIERLRGQMQTSRESSKRQSSGRAVEIHERLVVLSKEDSALRYRIIRKLMKELLKIEEMQLSKQRDSSLQCPWPAPRQLLANPMTIMPSLWADEQLMHDYTIAFTDKENPRVFDTVNRLVTSVFGDYLPSPVWPTELPVSATGGNGKPKTGVGVLREHADPEVLPGFYEVKSLLEPSLQRAEYEQECHSWLDFPENMERFIQSTRPQRQVPLSLGPDAGAYWNDDHWARFHGRTIRKILVGLRKHGLESKILASSLAPDYYRQLGGVLPVRLIAQYLAGDLTRKSAIRRLRNLSSQVNLERSLKLLDQGPPR